MKFSFAAILAILSMTDGKKKKNSILRRAVPVNSDGSVRKLDGDFEVTADYSIIYKECASVQVYGEDFFDLGNGIADMAYNGEVVAEQSYIIFNLTNDNYSYQDGSNSALFMIPIADWVQYISGEENDQENNEEYCEACDKSYDSCYPDDDKDGDNDQGEEQQRDGEDNEGEEQDNQDREKEGENEDEQQRDGEDNEGREQDNKDGEKEGGNEGGGERKLKKKRAMTPAIRAHRDSFAHLMGKRRYLANSCYQTVDCDICEAKGCFDGEQQEQENDNYCDQDNFYDGNGCVLKDETVQEFMKNAACVDTGLVTQDQYANAYNMKAGLICEEHGYGVEIAMFLDDDCTWYDKNMNFYKHMAGTYIYKLFNATKSQIQQPYEEDIDCSKCGYAAIGDQDGDDDDGNNDNEVEVNKICENIVKNSLDLYSCGNEQQAYNQYNQYKQSDGVDRSWYEADIEQEDVDTADVCLFLQGHTDDLSNYRVYSSKNGGGNGTSFFDYSKSHRKGSSSLLSKPGRIVALCGAIAMVIVGGILIGRKFAKKDPKKVPLVSNRNGAMA